MLNSLLEGCIVRVDFLFVVFVGRSWRCSECFAKSAALEGRMLSFWVQEAFLVDLLMSRISCRLLWLRRRCCPVPFYNLLEQEKSKEESSSRTNMKANSMGVGN